LNKANRYIDHIISGEVNHGDYILKLCQWHLSEVANSGEYYYDEKEANRYTKFIEKLKFVEGKWAGNNFILQDWQSFFLSMIFGWKVKSTGLRRFKQVTLNVPKKNGKTALAAVISIACSFLDKEVRGQIIIAATSQDQSALCFNAAKATVEADSELMNLFLVREHRLVCKKNQTYIKYVSSEKGAQEGKGASVVIFDEEHLQLTDELRDSLKTGQAAREQPLFISISTAGTNKQGPYFNHLKVCKSIVNGTITNDSHLVLIYCAPEVEKLDWENPKVWKIANPNWGVSIIPENFETEYIEAKNDPSKQPNFITKKLNIWADSSATWIDSKLWALLKTDKKLEDFEGEDIYLGLDLGVTGDFSALSTLIPMDGYFYLFMKFWIPEDMAKSRTKTDQINFTNWARSGFIKLTEGNATDYNVIEKDILELSTRFNVIDLSYDRAHAAMLTARLIDSGVKCSPFSQSPLSIIGPTKQMADWIKEGKLQHDGSPVMAWMMGNVVGKSDENGNFMLKKGMSKNKIDGPTSCVNAIGSYIMDYVNNSGGWGDEIIIV
jgi:phage terminase large subunit-like protein